MVQFTNPGTLLLNFDESLLENCGFWLLNYCDDCRLYAMREGSGFENHRNRTFLTSELIYYSNINFVFE